MPEIADKVDLGVRLEFLDIVMMFDRGWLGLRSLEALSAGRRLAKGPEPEMKRFGENINWDPAMRSANQWCDRLVAALRIKNRAAREKELRQIHWDFGTLRVRVANPDYRTKLFLALGSTKTRSENLGDLMLALSMPAMGKVQNAADRTRQVHDNLTLAFALAWYHRDHGRYPKTLDALAPKYVKEIPPDLFSGKPLIYPPSGSGYLLYSVGVNGKDEGGRGEEDMAPGDYLSVRMPQPDLPREGEAADPAPPPVP